MMPVFSICEACLRGDHGTCGLGECACRECWPEGDTDDDEEGGE